VAAAVLPVAAVLLPVHKLLALFAVPGHPVANVSAGAHTGAAVDAAAARAGRTSLLIDAAIFFVATLIAWAEKLGGPRSLSARTRRWLGVVVVTAAIVVGGVGAIAATHGDPWGFVKRQWHGFSHPGVSASSSHFTSVGSGRYDFWRVSLDAVAAHPIGGLGQDNFADYYLPRRRTYEEPAWTHSLELRLLASTGIVGFLLFGGFVVAAIVAAFPALRSRQSLTRAAAAAGLLPLVVWTAHGSVDWFWEMPALTGPALGFLGMAAALGVSEKGAVRRRARTGVLWRAAPVGAAAVVFLAAVVVLAFPYLSVRKTAQATALRGTNTEAALQAVRTAGDLNPWTSDPWRLGGTIALQTGQLTQAQKLYHQAVKRQPGDWFSWLGEGLAASALGDNVAARQDFARAAAINKRAYVVKHALAEVDTVHPLPPAEALNDIAQGLS
jgi:hypothetical protein